MFISRAQQLLHRLIIWGSLCLVMFLGDRFGAMNWLRGGIEYVSIPVVRSADFLVYSLTLPYRMWIFWQHGSNQVAKLEEQVAASVIDEVKLQQLEAENLALKNQLSLKDTTGFAMVATQILKHEQRVRILLGSRHGMQPGMVVVDSEGALVGSIDQVGVYTSSLRLLTDRDMRLAVITIRDTLGILLGNGESAVMTNVLQADVLSENDVIITSGEDDLFPRGIPVGKVTQVFGEEAAITKNAQVALIASLDKGVFVLK